MAMAAGELTRRITIQTLVTTVDPATGAEVPGAPTELAMVWAKVEPLRGMERFIQGMAQRFATDTLKFTIRYSSTVAGISPATHQIIYRGRIYDLETVDELGGAGLPEGLILTATLKGA
jgi:SPP1 family predicted phage head-tail adaptor